jgi:hypothetical protein
MRKTIISFALTLAPALLLAQQASSSTQGSAAVSASATTPKTQASVNGNAEASSDMSASAAPSSFSAANRARIDATFKAARERNLPEQPIRDRIAEGRAKGASEAQIVASAQRAEARLDVTQRAMVRAGRTQPSQSDVSSGYQAVVHGASEMEIQAVTQHTPSSRSLSVAFDALARLEASGMTPNRAAAQVVSSLDANVSDQSLVQLGATTSAAVNGTVGGPGSGVAGTTSAVGTATAGGVTGGVTGAVSGVIKKPPYEQN